jgi:RsmE family RNA methyltransferase
LKGAGSEGQRLFFGLWVNLLLLRPDEIRPDGTAELTGRRAAHVRAVLRSKPGDFIKVGLLDGDVGQAEILQNEEGHLVLRPRFEAAPPPRAHIRLLLALPRPKALKRVLASAASLGIDSLVLLGAYRVEKSYFDSHVLKPSSIEQFVQVGMEQAQDSRSPKILVEPRFRPFVEDRLSAWAAGAEAKLLAHPTAREFLWALPPPPSENSELVLAIGPEGGWTPFEVELLEREGFVAFTLGPRTLRVETCVALLAGALQTWRARVSSSAQPT